MRYLARLRLSQAAGYLTTTNATIFSIAQSTGYDTEASLSKAFKRAFGQSPGAYRRESVSRRSASPSIQQRASRLDYPAASLPFRRPRMSPDVLDRALHPTSEFAVAAEPRGVDVHHARRRSTCEIHRTRMWLGECLVQLVNAYTHDEPIFQNPAAQLAAEHE
jgi:hypothetical protein